jgi:hypothetical protein
VPGPHYGGPHSGPYESQQPNATEFEKIAQAGEILARLGLGQSTRTVAAAMGINRSTLYARMALINQPLPSPDLVRVIHFERLETMFEGLQGRIDGEATDADYARLRAEQRQVLARQSALLRVETPVTADAPAAPMDPAVREVLDAFEREDSDDSRG